MESSVHVGRFTVDVIHCLVVKLNQRLQVSLKLYKITLHQKSCQLHRLLLHGDKAARGAEPHKETSPIYLSSVGLAQLDGRQCVIVLETDLNVESFVNEKDRCPRQLL